LISLRSSVIFQRVNLFFIPFASSGECRFTFIDGRHKGNLSRFINHSCEPNLQLQVFRLGRPSPSLAMFAARDIQEGNEMWAIILLHHVLSTKGKIDVLK
jgi:hypothetical protein